MSAERYVRGIGQETYHFQIHTPIYPSLEAGADYLSTHASLSPLAARPRLRLLAVLLPGLTNHHFNGQKFSTFHIFANYKMTA
jgi:hypothetical protein